MRLSLRLGVVVLFAAAPLAASTLTVTNTSDSGAGLPASGDHRSWRSSC
jgi:hypothetical protein